MAQSASVNQTYFNKLAADYDSRFEQGIGAIKKALEENLDFIGVSQGDRLLDYACGTGLLSRSLASRVSQAVGIDVSESMVEAYNAKAISEGAHPETRVAHVGNLLLPSDPAPAGFAGPGFFGFNAAGVGMGFHHFDDPPLAVARLVERLRPGGAFFLVDFSQGQVQPTAGHGVHHAGFSEGQMREMFDGAGVGVDFAFKQVGEITFGKDDHGTEFKRFVFLARGTKK